MTDGTKPQRLVSHYHTAHVGSHGTRSCRWLATSASSICEYSATQRDSARAINRAERRRVITRQSSRVSSILCGHWALSPFDLQRMHGAVDQFENAGAASHAQLQVAPYVQKVRQLGWVSIPQMCRSTRRIPSERVFLAADRVERTQSSISLTRATPSPYIGHR
jgi:hypothetical protein